MKYRSNNNRFLQNALVVSVIVHGAGIYFLSFWTTTHKPHVPEFNPIQITKIVYEPSTKPKMEKVVAPAVIPVEKVFTKANAAEPIPAVPRQEIKPTQPIATVRTSAYKYNSSLSNNSPKRRVSIPGNALQRPVIENVMKRSSIIPVINSKIGAQNISGEKSLFIASRKRYPEAVSDIRKASASHVQPVQLTSMPEEFVAASHEENLPASLGPPEISGAPPSRNLELLSKSFSDSVWGKISVAKFYPKIARRHGWEGKPVIEFQVGKNGNLVSYSIAVASPYEVLNQAALDAVKNASPYPKIPEPLQRDSIIFKLPISFILEER